jgi:signal transduction histidine kinase
VREVDGELRFEVVDDGAGFDRAATSAGIGLTGMQDRIAALDGELRIDSSPGGGTAVGGGVPLSVSADRRSVVGAAR